VDIDEIGKKLINDKSIKNGDLVAAEVYSDVAEDGQTRLWYLKQIDKINVA
jgi:hypothetical protein